MWSLFAVNENSFSRVVRSSPLSFAVISRSFCLKFEGCLHHLLIVSTLATVIRNYVRGAQPCLLRLCSRGLAKLTATDLNLLNRLDEP